MKNIKNWVNEQILNGNITKQKGDLLIAYLQYMGKNYIKTFIEVMTIEDFKNRNERFCKHLSKTLGSLEYAQVGKEYYFS